MKMKEIRSTDGKDLKGKISEMRLELMKEIANVKRRRPIKNPGKIKALRKDVARMLTVKREKEAKK